MFVDFSNGHPSSPTFNIKNMLDLESYFSAIHSPRLMNGADVNIWHNIGSNTNNAIQATDADQPLYDSTGLNGAPTLTFDGSGDFMQVDSVLALEGEWDIYTVLDSATPTISKRWFSGRATASNADALDLGHPGDGSPRTVYNNSVATFTDLSFIIDTPTIVRHNFDGTTLRCYQDGVLSSITFVASGSISDLTRAIGALWQDSSGGPIGFYWNGSISEIALFSKIKTDVENNAILSYLSFIYKIPVTLL